MKLYITELWKHFTKDEALGMAAQCAYYFLFSMFPFLLFAVSLLGYMPFTSKDILELIEGYIPLGAATGIEALLQNLLDVKRGGALSFGLIFSLISASAAMDAIVLAINKAYGLPKRKSFIHSRFLAVLLTGSMLIVIISALLLSVFGRFIGDWMHGHIHLPMYQVELWNALRWIINFIILFLVFTGLYYIAPNTCLNCKDVLVGALIAALGWQLVSWGFSYYVNNWTNYSATYGSLGGVIVLLTWFYLCALIIIVGGEINATTYLFKKKGQ
ncbi:YihY/virulence factor BrkB family protein [Paenibacillus thalictri]|uniref:YihY/virulence factor BrkB family protein n=1 Tax=Paenibacillus thalictri TaxID=2527873 RepID=A0A4Q9DWD1_9BACL|nr:YihY/virulence factor BrkB family protein [Paenibacillus thalictri]